MMTYREVSLNYLNNPRDVHTVLKDGSIGHWFYTYTKNGIIYASPAKNHKPSCSMQQPIKIKEEQFNGMRSLYHKRIAGEKVSKEATDMTRAQVYWYGILNDLGL